MECKTEECKSEVRARGLCHRCCSRLYRSGLLKPKYHLGERTIQMRCECGILFKMLKCRMGRRKYCNVECRIKFSRKRAGSRFAYSDNRRK